MDVKPSRSQSWDSAALLIVGATIGFAFKGIWARFAYQAGLTVTAVLLLRILCATPIYWLGAFLLRSRASVSTEFSWRDRLSSLGCGMFFMTAAVCDFVAIDRIGAGPSRVILFSFPGLVLVIDSVRRRKWPARYQVVAFAVAWVGLIGVAAPHGLSAALEGGGVVWAFSGAVAYAVYLTMSQAVTQRIGSLRFSVWSNNGTALAFLGALPFVATEADFVWPEAGVAWVLLLALVSTVVPYFLLFEGIRRAGAVQASLLTLIGPPITVFAAWWLLDEQLTPGQLVGTAFVLAGVASLKRRA